MGGEHDGLLVAHYEVHCRGCGSAYLGLGTNRPRAVSELLRSGWVNRRRRWFCAETCKSEDPQP